LEEKLMRRATLALFLAVGVWTGCGTTQMQFQKVESVCPSGNPDPKEPKHRDVNHWKKEIRAFLKNLQQMLKRMPNNKAKRQPVEDAIRRGEDALTRWSSS
jgi:hypothetical protein